MPGFCVKTFVNKKIIYNHYRGAVMIVKVIEIGNSKGIRIPNQILKEMNIEKQIELIISDSFKRLVR